VRNLFIPLSVGLLCTSFTLIPIVQTASSVVVASAPVDEVSSVYNSIQLDQYGLSKEAFTYAWKGYQQLLDKKMISRTNYLTICDLSQSSKQKRLYIIDVANNKLLINTWVAHGRNSGGEYATKFSNKPESLQSSLGFYITSGTYYGEHGLSLRINGIEPGFNDKALERSIVIHGAAYVDGARARSGMYMGRSWGCPAVPQKESTTIINTIKNGTCLFIYHPSKDYLNGSKILND
jgi:L,D-transpeptidase catalytic domain